MKIKYPVKLGFIIFISTLVFGCSLLADQPQKSMAKQPATFGNSENVKVVKNPTMMFHDIVVKQTNEGAELEGKVHVMGHQDYVPGHIDIAVIDKSTGQNISAVSTDFNSRVARHGRYNFKHSNNIGTRLPGVDPDKTTIVVAYHYSNVDRLSMSDCGANVALASISKQ